MALVSETNKRTFVTNFRNNLTTIIQAITRAQDAIKIFLAKDFASGQADEITDAHLLALGITYADLVEGKGLIDNLMLFVDNGQPAQDDYRKIFNNLRTDFGV